MYFKSVEDKRILNILSSWIDEDGEVFVDVYIPRSGSGTTRLIMRSPESFIKIINDLPLGASVDILRASLYPLVGTIDEALIENVRQNNLDDQLQEVHIFDDGEEERVYVHEVESIVELLACLEKNLGALVRVGPFVHIPNQFEDIDPRTDLICASKLE